MKLRVEKTQLLTAINRVQGALTEKNLAQIGVKASDNTLTVMAMDRHISIYCDIETEIDQTGTVFLPARLFSDVTRELPNSLVYLEVENSWFNITAGEHNEFNMRLPLIDDLMWSDKPEITAASSVVLNTDQLSYMISQVQFCVAMESPHNYGSVGYLHKNEEGGLRLVGTDGFRLSYCDIKCSMPENFLHKGVCLSKRALNEFLKICNEGFETVSLSLSEDESTLVLQVSGYSIFIRLSNVQYPNYQGVLPSKHPFEVEVSRPQMQSVTKRVMLAADKTRAVRLNFQTDNLVLSSKTMGGSSGSEEVAISEFEGKDCHLAVNGKFLSDVFNTTTSTSLRLEFNGQSDPFVIIPVSEPQQCVSKHVLVPIHESQ